MDHDRVSQLLARIGREDQAAFRELYKAFSRKVFAYVLSLLNDHARAEEVLVDTMVEIWRNPARFRGDSQLRTGLIRIARRKALMLYSSGRGTDTAGAADGVQGCVDKLPDEQRECMHLVLCTGLSLGEVAEVQDCPAQSVKTRLLQARQLIKGCLQQQQGEGVPA